MSDGTKTHDLGQITVNFGGVPLDALGGWGDGGGITVGKEVPSFTKKIGADGSVTRSKTYNKVFMVTLVLGQKASANKILAALLLLDETADNGAGIVPIVIADRGGLNLLSGTEAWIEGHPKELKFEQEANNLEWVICVADGVGFYGGG